MRRIIFLLLALSLMFSICSCNGTNNKNNENSKSDDHSSVVSDNADSEQKGNIYDSTDAFTYMEVEGGLSISQFKNYDYIEYDKIIVPSEIDGKIVVGIGDINQSDRVLGAVFGNCEVVIPDTVTYIGQNAFSGAKGLVKLSGGKNCKTIGKNAFLGCENLSEITFIDTVTDLADDAFAGCTKWEVLH